MDRLGYLFNRRVKFFYIQDGCVLRSLGLALVVMLLLLMPSAARAVPFTGDLVVQSWTRASPPQLTEYLADGTVLQNMTIELGPGGAPRDIMIGHDGILHLFAGTYDPYLVTYNPTTNA